MVARGVVSLVNDGLKLQGVQLAILDGEIREAERFQQYGFTSVPLPGAEAVVVFVGGRRDHGLVVAVDDRRYRKKGLLPGEVALYNQGGLSIVLRTTGIEINAAGALPIILNGKVVFASTDVALGQPAEDAAMKGTAFNSALGTFLTALSTYVTAIRPTADPSYGATAPFATAITAFSTAASGALSEKVKIG